MDPAVFINASISKKRDLIFSFALVDEEMPDNIRTLVLLRCPAYEGIFDEDERGVTVSMEGEHEDENDIQGHLLSEFTLNAAAKTVILKTPRRSYELDIRKVAASELAKGLEILGKMNFDGKVKVVGV